MTTSPTSVAALQLCATEDVAQNLKTALELGRNAANAGAQALFFPEAFAYIGREAGKREMLEPLPQGGPILHAMQELAQDTQCDVVLGGFHEQIPASNKSFNTCVHLDRAGSVRALYRKVHLFDVDLKDGTRLAESKGTEPGDSAVCTELGFGTLGLTVCYDLRFPYLYQNLVDQGAIALTVPSAFTATTGAAHWHALLRARAIETQCYVIAPAQYGQHNPKRASFGHSLIIDPWGEIIAELADGDGWALAEIDPARVADVRAQLPSLRHRRPVN